MAKSSYESLSDSSRIWIYRSDRLLSAEETLKIDNWLNQFTEKWTAHNQSLKAFGQVYHSKFIVILLDEESSNQASGCSIDSQVRFIKDIGKALNVDFFDRLHFDFLIDNSIITIHKNKVLSKIEEGILSEESLVLDHLVKSKMQFEHAWSVPLSQSWHRRLI
tara:strand:- start:1387 stop:1875 length:489 start_codon:yes stop_codon:yes gene_type:complete